MRNIATEWLGKLSVLLRKPRSAELQPMLSTFYELDQTKSIEYLYERTQDMQTTLLSLVMDKTLQASAVNYLYSSFCNKLPTYDDQFKLLVIDFALRLSSNLKASLSAPVSKVRVTDAHLISSFFHQIHPLWQQHDKIIIAL